MANDTNDESVLATVTAGVLSGMVARESRRELTAADVEQFAREAVRIARVAANLIHNEYRRPLAIVLAAAAYDHPILRPRLLSFGFEPGCAAATKKAPYDERLLFVLKRLLPPLGFSFEKAVQVIEE